MTSPSDHERLDAIRQEYESHERIHVACGHDEQTRGELHHERRLFLNRLAAVEHEREEARLEAKAVVIAPLAMRCMTCGTAAHQPNDRCEAHISFPDRLQTEVEMHNAWRKRATEAEAALLSLQTAVREVAGSIEKSTRWGDPMVKRWASKLRALLTDPAGTK